MSTHPFIIFSLLLLLGNSSLGSQKGLYSLPGDFPLYPSCLCTSVLPIRPPKLDAQEAPWSSVRIPLANSLLWQWGATAPFCSLEVPQLAVLFVMLSVATNWWTLFQSLVSWPHSSCGFSPLVGLGLSSEVNLFLSPLPNRSCLHYSVPNLHGQDLGVCRTCLGERLHQQFTAFYFSRVALLDLAKPVPCLECLPPPCVALPWRKVDQQRHWSYLITVSFPRETLEVYCRIDQCTPSQLIRARTNSSTHPDSRPLSCLLLLSVQSQTKPWHKAYRIKMFSYHMVAHPPLAPPPFNQNLIGFPLPVPVMFILWMELDMIGGIHSPWKDDSCVCEWCSCDLLSRSLKDRLVKFFWQKKSSMTTIRKLTLLQWVFKASVGACWPFFLTVSGEIKPHPHFFLFAKFVIGCKI